MGDEVTAKFRCKDCGTLIEWNEELEDDAIVKCPGCGAEVGTLANLKSAAIEAVKEMALKKVRDAFRKR